MKFELDGPSSGLTIQYYDATYFIIGGQRYIAPFVVTPSAVHQTILPSRFGEIAVDHFIAIAGLGVEIIVVGSGSRQLFIGDSVSKELTARGIGIESMNTSAACRCYNVLAAEHRAVAAAIYPLDPPLHEDGAR